MDLIRCVAQAKPIYLDLLAIVCQHHLLDERCEIDANHLDHSRLLAICAFGKPEGVLNGLGL
jgi:hypothetical protein